MSKFGWSLPPGVSKLPYDESCPCVTCGHTDDDCICPECPICHEYGNPYCYEQKHLHYNKQQLLGQAELRVESHRMAMADEGLYIEWLTQQPDDYKQL